MWGKSKGWQKKDKNRVIILFVTDSEKNQRTKKRFEDVPRKKEREINGQ